MTGTLHIVLAMKPMQSGFVENALKHGVAGLNIDGARVSVANAPRASGGSYGQGRWPANVILDDSDVIVSKFPDVGKSGIHGRGQGGFNSDGSHNCFGKGSEDFDASGGYRDSGSAARFFKQVKG